MLIQYPILLPQVPFSLSYTATFSKKVHPWHGKGMTAAGDWDRENEIDVGRTKKDLDSLVHITFSETLL